MKNNNVTVHPDVDVLMLYFLDKLELDKSESVRMHVLTCRQCSDELAVLCDSENVSDKEALEDPLYLKAEQFIQTKIEKPLIELAAKLIIGIVITTRAFTLTRAAVRCSSADEEMNQEITFDYGTARLWTSASKELMMTLSLRKEINEKFVEPSPIFLFLKEEDSKKEYPLCFIIPKRHGESLIATSSCGPLEVYEPLDKERTLNLQFENIKITEENREAFIRSVDYLIQQSRGVKEAWRIWIRKKLQVSDDEIEKNILKDALAKVEEG